MKPDPPANTPPATANGRWGAMLAGWAIPEELRAAAKESPYFFDPKVFTQAAEESLARTDDSPSDQVAREALPAVGSVLDVGCGAGAASLRLQPETLVGVDSNKPLLEEFETRAARLGIRATAVEGSWPEAAEQCPQADIVVCHHVFYNVADLAAFATALDGHARRRAVVELTAVHPMAWLAPYWLALHGLEQPDRPTAADAVAVLEELGLEVRERRWRRRYQMIGEHTGQGLERMARRLCLPTERYAELRRLLEEIPPPSDREVATLWW